MEFNCKSPADATPRWNKSNNVDTEGICDVCAHIDPSLIQEADSSDSDEYPQIDYVLKNSSDMHASAQAGCAGCAFFLEVLARRCADDQQDMNAFIHRGEDIYIRSGNYLETDLEERSHQALALQLDLCLVEKERDYKYEPGWHEPSRPISKDPRSDECMNMAATWLDECQLKHPECAVAAEVVLPSRVIEVIPPTAKNVPGARLHVSSDSEQGRFATLSHCWGGKVACMLKKENLEQFQECIPWTELSQSFQDAVWIAWRLGFEYIWIDALCIVQDSAEDWAKEAAQMAHIYSSGAVMLSALAAPDGSHGLLCERTVLRSHTWDPSTKSMASRQRFLRRDHGRDRGTKLQDQAEGSDEAENSEDELLFGKKKENERRGPLCYQTQSEWTSFQNSGPRPLDSRGWCYQERIMAPRIIHFSAQKMLWECGQSKWAEDWGIGFPDIHPESEKKAVEPYVRQHHGRPSEQALEVVEIDGLARHESKVNALKATKLSDLDPDVYRRLATFYDCVLDYKRRELTYGSDMLPAFSGLASIFHAPELGEYIAGLWEADLVYGLSWFIARDVYDDDDVESTQADMAQDEDPYVAPSWSWASIPIGASFQRNRTREMILDKNGGANSNWPQFYATWEATFKPVILSHQVRLATSDPFGRIEHAELTLRGWCRPILVYYGPRDEESHINKLVTFDARTEEPHLRGSRPWKFGPPCEYVNWLSSWPRDLEDENPATNRDVKEFMALQVGLQTHGTGSASLAVVSLILDAVEGQDGTYRRVGTLDVQLDKLDYDEFDEMERRRWIERELRLI